MSPFKHEYSKSKQGETLSPYTYETGTFSCVKGFLNESGLGRTLPTVFRFSRLYLFNFSVGRDLETEFVRGYGT